MSIEIKNMNIKIHFDNQKKDEDKKSINKSISEREVAKLWKKLESKKNER